MTGLVRRLLRQAARSRALARTLFGIDFPAHAPGERYFDLTTAALVRSAAARLAPGRRLLDMGTGLFATVGLATWKRTGCALVCSDRDPRIVERARVAVALNGAPAEVVCADLFDGLPGPFDVVAFNPPYVPTERLQSGERFRGQSDGGGDGSDVLARFLQGFAADGRGHVALLGTNDLFVPRPRMEALVAAVPGLALERVERAPLLPARVYVVIRR